MLTFQSLRRLPAAQPLRLVLLALLVVGGSTFGCGRAREKLGRPPAEMLESLLTPTAATQTLRRVGGAHYHGSTAFDIGAEGGAHDAIATTTDLWMDDNGNYRLVELNDRDGGREVILHGKDLAVALRYGRLIKRPAQEPEVSRFLEEAIGGPWAAWEIARRMAAVERTTDKDVDVYRLTKAATPQPVKAGFDKSSPLRKWRDTVSVETVSGEVRVDRQNKLVLSTRLVVTFSLRRENVPLKGVVRVESWLRDRGAVATLPAPRADELVPRQRTILDERALLGRASGEPARPTKGTR